MSVIPVEDRNKVELFHQDLGSRESEVIALGLESSPSRLILDDRKARMIARQHGMPITGTMAVLLKARERRLIDEVRPHVDRMRAEGFRMSERLYPHVIQMAGEI